MTGEQGYESNSGRKQRLAEAISNIRFFLSQIVCRDYVGPERSSIIPTAK